MGGVQRPVFEFPVAGTCCLFPFIFDVLVMDCRLPQDLIELVVEELSKSSDDDRTRSLVSCSLVSRPFIRPCQKALFHSVPIHPVLPKEQQMFNPDYQRSLSLARAINGSPHLGLYVRKVVIWIPRSKTPLPADEDQDEIARAMHGMEMIDPASYEVSLPSQIKTELSRMMLTPQLRHFALKNVKAFPGKLILEAYQLESLELTSSRIAEPTLPSDILHVRDTPIGYLKTLICDSPTASRGIGNLLLMSEQTGPHGLQLEKIETLDVQIPTPAHRPINVPILKNSVHLLNLHVTTGPPIYYPAPYISALGELNPQSFATLAILHVDLIFNVHESSSPAHMVIRDPYLGLCKSVLGSLHALTDFKLVINFQGCHKLPPESFGPQWGRLADVLMTPNAFPKLKSVCVLVKLQLGSIYSAWPHEEASQNARDMKRAIKESVYEEQLRCLHEMEAGGRRVDFSFQAIISQEKNTWLM
ncbi:hypothetical protein NMY22_g11048 [Coprinellus aureogranulatus]|nr:hypothetical protein NMY22_g11048 [Coprinellus aureogranulatus]